MDIFSALQTSVSGLQAQSYALNNISGNIANSQTTGFKRIDTNFIDLMAEQTPKQEVSGTVIARAQLTNTLQGTIGSTTVSTNMAINGQGFFTVTEKTGDANGQTTFGSSNVYTRRGDFTQDQNGYLVNGAGAYLTGSNINPSTGQVTSTGPIQIGNATLPAAATSAITYAANLPATPATTASATSGSDLYAPTDAASQAALVTTTDGSVTNGLQITAANAPTFNNNSIAGPALTAYNTTGAPVSISTRWAKVQDGTSTTPSVWNLFYQSDTTQAGTNSPWTNVGTGFTFNSAGQMQQPATGTVTINALTVGGTNIGNVTLNVGTSGLTQYADASGAVTTNTLTQNGNSSGTLTSVAVGSDGKINGTFSNGTVAALASAGVVRFANPDGLTTDPNGNYQQTADSGPPLSGLNGSTINGSSIEQSNTDIAGEFSKMIVTQQAYSANTKVMSTAQSMMTDLLNILR